MRFGDVIVIQRGGHKTPRPGQYRNVRVRYLGARGHQIYCELLQDDPDATVGYCTKKGERGWWGRSIIVEDEKKRRQQK